MRTSELLVTVLVGGVAVGLVAAQFAGPGQPGDNLTLPELNHRVSQLRQATTPAERDLLCDPMAASARSLDRILRKDARIFLSGMIGVTNAPDLKYFFFLRNYLFPRTIELSVDGHAVYHESGVEGVAENSTDELKARGFDLVIKVAPDGEYRLLPLTEKGMPQ